MTIDEAISHALEVAGEQQERADSAELIDVLDGLDVEACKQCAADHRQLAEWLTDYKELKNSIGAVKLSNMKEVLELIREYKAENIAQKKLIAEYKRLLKAAVEDFNCDIDSICAICKHNDLVDGCPYIESYSECEYNWRYTDEALKLIGGSENG